MWDIKPFASQDRCLKYFEGASHGNEKNLLGCWLETFFIISFSQFFPKKYSIKKNDGIKVGGMMEVKLLQEVVIELLMFGM